MWSKNKRWQKWGQILNAIFQQLCVEIKIIITYSMQRNATEYNTKRRKVREFSHKIQEIEGKFQSWLEMPNNQEGNIWLDLGNIKRDGNNILKNNTV